jgi:anthranilate phosphoribosyltransferase
MRDIRPFLERLLDGHSLSVGEAEVLMTALTEPETPAALTGAVLAALRSKGEHTEEIQGFARAMRHLAVCPDVPVDGPPLVDTCGTGGDGSGSLNLSTAAALVSAAAGLRVVKHGNRSISSRAGSADVLEALGVPVVLGPEEATAMLARTGFTFLFAPHYHPAMKAVMPVRRAMGVRTVFNILGPLTNPVRPPYQVVGAFSLAAAEKMANALAGLHLVRGFVVHGAMGWDEATPVGPFHLFDVRPGSVTHEMRDPLDVGIARCAASDLLGGEPEENAMALESLLNGAPGAHRDAVCLSAGLALEVTGMADDLRHGVQLAEAALDAGKGRALLESLRQEGQ